MRYHYRFIAPLAEIIPADSRPSKRQKRMPSVDGRDEPEAAVDFGGQDYAEIDYDFGFMGEYSELN